MTHYLFIIVGAVLVNNVVLVKILGLCPFMGVSKKVETAFGMGAATTFVLTVATGASYVAFGAFFPTTTKVTTRRATPQLLRDAKPLGVP